MTAPEPEDDLAYRLSRAVLEVDAVRGLFPHSVVAAAAGILIGSAATRTTALVDVTSRNGVHAVAARLSIDATASSTSVVVAVREALARTLGTDDFTLQVEIAHLASPRGLPGT